MSRPWRYEDDEFLVSYFDSVGDYIGEHDLGRPKGAATRRVAHLKATGAWDALCRKHQVENRGNIASLRAELEYARALGFKVEETGCSDEAAEAPADIYDGTFPWRRDPYGEKAEAVEDAERELFGEMLSLLQEVLSHGERCHWFADSGDRDLVERIEAAIADAEAA